MAIMASAGAPMGFLLSAPVRLVWNRPAVFTQCFCGVYCHYENIAWRRAGHGSRNREQKDGRDNGAAVGDNRVAVTICSAALVSAGALRPPTRARSVPGDPQRACRAAQELARLWRCRQVSLLSGTEVTLDTSVPTHLAANNEPDLPQNLHCGPLFALTPAVPSARGSVVTMIG